MIHKKTQAEIEIMKQGGKILDEVMQILIAHAKPGVTMLEIDQLAEKEIRARGAEPSFQRVEDYKWTICSCVNDVVVHGIPKNEKIQELDVVGIDCGVYLNGFHTDSSWTVRSSSNPKRELDEVDRFIALGEETLHKAIAQVKPGNHIYDISKVIQDGIEGAGYSVMRTLVGHGVGHELHEDPEIPGLAKKKRLKTPVIEEGMAFAVEVIYAMGKPEIIYKGNDGWTIATKDGKISALFEATVVVTSHGCIVLTTI